MIKNIEKIIQNNEDKTKEDIFRFLISFTLKIVLSLFVAVLTLRFYKEKDFISAVFETAITFLWFVSLYLDVDILIFKIKNNNKMMSIFIKHEVLLEMEKVINTAEEAIETAQIETEE